MTNLDDKLICRPLLSCSRHLRAGNEANCLGSFIVKHWLFPFAFRLAFSARTVGIDHYFAIHSTGTMRPCFARPLMSIVMLSFSLGTNNAFVYIDIVRFKCARIVFVNFWLCYVL
jgi:hypothetical protein